MTTFANVADQATVAFSGAESCQKQTAFARRTENTWGAAAYSIWRWYRRARIKAAFQRLSDRILQDIGFDPNGDLNAQIDARIDSQQAEKERARQIYRELMAYTDAELDDIGIRRVDIGTIARGEYPFEVPASNPATTVSRPVSAANDSHNIAAA